MKHALILWFATTIALPVLAHADTITPKAFKTDKEVLETFYKLLNNTGDDSNLHAASRAVVGAQWDAEPDSQGGDGLDGFVHTFMRYHQFIPDMYFTPREILSAGRHRYVVRSLASGTAMMDFLDIGNSFVPGSRFNIMTIEIHTIKNGKVVKTYHVEDWKNAITQLSQQ